MLKGYVNVPREQFFNTDYHSLIRDRFSNVLDEQVPTHFNYISLSFRRFYLTFQ